MNGIKTKVSGILKDYTANYVEILNVQIKTPNDKEYKVADLILPRTLATVRHAEKARIRKAFSRKNSVFSSTRSC